MKSIVTGFFVTIAAAIYLIGFAPGTLASVLVAWRDNPVAADESAARIFFHVWFFLTLGYASLGLFFSGTRTVAVSNLDDFLNRSRKQRNYHGAGLHFWRGKAVSE